MLVEGNSEREAVFDGVAALPTRTEKSFEIRAVTSIEQLMHVVAIRSAVFISEQDCPYYEEFDGNDFCATHMVAYRGREPVACIRIRYFGDFAKLERLAVRHEYRNSRISFQLVWSAIDLAKRKGFARIYGHAQDRLVRFWSHFGARPMKGRRPLVFSDFAYTEMLLETSPLPNAISLASDGYVIIRPEGDWDRPGVLEDSAARPVSSPLRNLRAA